MERVTRISKMTVDNFEQLMMTVEGLSYENNSKELIDMLKILQAQVNMRVQELEKLNVVEVEENYSDDFINTLSENATHFGAVENRLESALESIEVNIANLASSRSTIKDADIAKVSAEYIQQQILQQAAATLMSTANQSPAIALQLI